MSSNRINEIELLDRTIHNLVELRQFWQETLEKYFAPRTLCLLLGPMGVGKTECLKQVSSLGKFSDVSSPSFAIHHRSQNPQGQTLDHVDLFRLQSEEDLDGTGFWDLFQTSESWIFVEWGDMLELEFWPLDWSTLIVRLEKTGQQQERRIILSRLVR